ncbi:MAG: beta-lactamase class C [Colwellia sp.]|jgi:beta-lactamase class C
MLFRLFCFSLMLLLTAFSSANNVTPFKQRFCAQVKQQLKQYSIRGGAYVIVQNKNIIAMDNFGHTDKTKAHDVDNNTVFRLISVSKTFAATITTMLAQEKQLSLSDPITKYVPHFALATNGAAQKIQLKHLLSHSSGLMPNAYDNLLYENWPMEKIIGRFVGITPIC